MTGIDTGSAAGDFDRHERGLWVGKAEAYRASFAALCGHAVPALLAAGGVAAGVRVLDVGTGPGTAARAAQQLGAVVSAVDADPGMVALAVAGGVAARVAVLPELPYEDGAYESVVGNFVVNHVEHPAAAMAELRRVARPGGRLAATIWADAGNGSMDLFVRALAVAEHGRPVPPRVPEALNFERSAAGFAELAVAAGWDGVSCRELLFEHRVTPADWWAGVAAGVANLGYVVTGLPTEQRARVEAEYRRLAAAAVGADGLLTVPAVALLVSGRA
ncbi:methyltransferase type 11 [Kitasatospora sp. MMS16-BH015]|uniref:class I SAM-dependent methyltransferase n=1 Tax=Kitasatospora sp. MMS16-BH015 TaxID=2018025 RepID=UPI000CA14DBE|nr:class I SAM-dependent methyltransferase [Kitasatospora sp. MMS16-BH015]AUG78847.1 methyltransferase type 11 [Kitasatospora sp. MMS16-BH015]